MTYSKIIDKLTYGQLLVAHNDFIEWEKSGYLAEKKLGRVIMRELNAQAHTYGVSVLPIFAHNLIMQRLIKLQIETIRNIEENKSSDGLESINAIYRRDAM